MDLDTFEKNNCSFCEHKEFSPIIFDGYQAVEFLSQFNFPAKMIVPIDAPVGIVCLNGVLVSYCVLSRHGTKEYFTEYFKDKVILLRSAGMRKDNDIYIRSFEEGDHKNDSQV